MQGIPARLQVMGLLGQGASGEVFVAYDHRRGREVALKRLRPSLSLSPTAVRRFLREVEVTARLEHPHINPIYDWSEEVEAGAPMWYTSRLVRGPDGGAATFTAVLADLARRRRGVEGDGALREIIPVLESAALAVAYAHSEGVAHRDLKPDNLLLGRFGEVAVVDWGLAWLGEPGADESGETGARPFGASGDQTLHGAILGTPAYMAPEQAVGDPSLHGPAVDVYALGAILYHILCGVAPYADSAGRLAEPFAQLSRLRAGPPPPILSRRGDDNDRVAPLIRLCEAAMARAQRTLSAATFAQVLRDWRNGALDLERARAIEAEILAEDARVADVARRIERLRGEAVTALAGVAPHAPEEEKVQAWRRLEEAEREETALERARLSRSARLRAAVELQAGGGRAATLLAEDYTQRLVEADRAGDRRGTLLWEGLLSELPDPKHRALARRVGRLSIQTTAPGVEVTASPIIERERRLCPDEPCRLGVAPLVDVELPSGSVLLTLRAPGHATVRLPVFVPRGGAWDHTPPGGGPPPPIWIPKEHELGEDEVYVPGGWFFSGDPDAPDGLSRRRLWVDDLIMQRDPITNAEWLELLNELVRLGREDEAQALLPGAPEGDGAMTHPLFQRDTDGLFLLGRSALEEGADAAAPDAPIAMMTFFAAEVYAQLRAARDGLPWRLPHDQEWEKAARGVDARRFPYGNHLDPAWVCMAQSFAGPPHRAPLGRFSRDVSPYGARSMGGNVRVWCSNGYRRDGVPDGARVLWDEPQIGEVYRMQRGGSWSSSAAYCQAGARFVGRPEARSLSCGVRLVRTTARRR